MNRSIIKFQKATMKEHCFTLILAREGVIILAVFQIGQCNAKPSGSLSVAPCFSCNQQDHFRGERNGIIG